MSIRVTWVVARHWAAVLRVAAATSFAPVFGPAQIPALLGASHAGASAMRSLRCRRRPHRNQSVPD